MSRVCYRKRENHRVNPLNISNNVFTLLRKSRECINALITISLFIRNVNITSNFLFKIILNITDMTVTYNFYQTHIKPNIN